MNRLLIAVLILTTSFPAVAQEDDTIQFIHGLPVTGEDTSSNEYQKGLNVDNFVSVSREQIPPRMVKTLQKNRLYVNWENQPVYYDKKMKLYWIVFRDSNTVRSYGFNETGVQVTLREEDISADESSSTFAEE